MKRRLIVFLIITVFSVALTFSVLAASFQVTYCENYISEGNGISRVHFTRCHPGNLTYYEIWMKGYQVPILTPDSYPGIVYPSINPYPGYTSNAVFSGVVGPQNVNFTIRTCQHHSDLRCITCYATDSCSSIYH